LVEEGERAEAVVEASSVELDTNESKEDHDEDSEDASTQLESDDGMAGRGRSIKPDNCFDELSIIQNKNSR
jgi:hypothetical protein